MPLKKVPKGASKKTRQRVISKNISRERHAGKPQKRAVAIAHESARSDVRKSPPTPRLRNGKR